MRESFFTRNLEQVDLFLQNACGDDNVESNGKELVSLVDVSKYEGLTDAVKKALDLISFNFERQMKKVVIKLNLCNYWKSSTGETTDPKIIEAIVNVLREYGAADEIFLVESDATVMRAKYAFRILGYEELAQKKELKLINLCEDTLLPCGSSANPTSRVFNQIRIPKTLREANLFISVPKLKLHSLTGLTCALKNQFGCIPIRKKIIFHQDLSRAIAFINKLLPPDLILVDGVISKGKTPKKLNLVMAGYDPVSVDYVAAKIAGLNPKKVKHLVESENLGVGSTQVDCVGESWSRFAENFPRKGFFYAASRKYLLSLYGLYLRLFTLEGRVFKMQPAPGG